MIPYSNNISLMAKIPHFFKVKSRVGLTNPPIRHSELNLGVEDAPDSVISPAFLENFPSAKINDFSFTTPEEMSKDEYWEIVAGELEQLKNLISKEVSQNETQVVIGGDNTVTLSSLEAVIERTGSPSQIGYIQFDSHGEMHQSKTSISKNFHGMYMRPFFDEFDVPLINTLVPKKLKTTQALTIGDIIFDGENTEEEQFYKNNQIRNINRKEYLQNKDQILKEIGEYLSRFEHFHINFDIDVFHESVSPATGLPEDGKWFKEEIFEILDLISMKTSLSVDMVEINPKKEGSEKTIKLAQEILLKLLS